MPKRPSEQPPSKRSRKLKKQDSQLSSKLPGNSLKQTKGLRLETKQLRQSGHRTLLTK